MKNKLIALVSMFLPVLFGSFANQVPQHVYPVAILPFAVKGEFDALYAEAAQDKFTTEIMKSNQYVVIGQPQLDKAIREANFTAGNSDEATAIKGSERTSARLDWATHGRAFGENCGRTQGRPRRE